MDDKDPVGAMIALLLVGIAFGIIIVGYLILVRWLT